MTLLRPEVGDETVSSCQACGPATPDPTPPRRRGRHDRSVAQLGHWFGLGGPAAGDDQSEVLRRVDVGERHVGRPGVAEI